MWGMKDKVVIITGAANGIGRATSEVFAGQGAQVVMLDIDLPLVEKGAREIEAGGGKALAMECDVSRGQSVKAMADKVMERFGHIDVLHANAALQVTRPACDVSEEEWDRMHNVNLKGVFLSCKYVIPVMQKQKKGAVIITSSGHAFGSYPNCSAYAATKGGELAYMRAVALDYAPDGVRVNCVIPGATDTRLIQSYLEESKNPEETRKQLLGSIPMKRLAKPEEIGHAVLFLASDYAAYITGTSLVVDGGILAQV
jgi:meso-butanediol dehydrogenase / (S,S)-butanediol dehydrogenase / diacetyl reductase